MVHRTGHFWVLCVSRNLTPHRVTFVFTRLSLFLKKNIGKQCSFLHGLIVKDIEGIEGINHLCLNHLCLNHLCLNHLCLNHLCLNHLCIKSFMLSLFKDNSIILFLMVRAYIYLVSFKDTNDIYIGKTKNRNVSYRFAEHKKDLNSSVNLYVKNGFNGDWSNVYIDVIDNIDINEDLTHLLSHPSNTIVEPTYQRKNILGVIKQMINY